MRDARERGLTGREVAILSGLARTGNDLTGMLARKLFGPGSSSRVRRPCLKMAEAGLVVRHETNTERWFITDLGRAALAERGGRNDG